MKQQVSFDEKDDAKVEESVTDGNKVEVEIVDQQSKETEETTEDVKDSWDAESSEDEQEEGIICVQLQIHLQHLFVRIYFNKG